MASLMTPTVAPSTGVTNRLNSFEQDMSSIDQARRNTETNLNAFNSIAKNLLAIRLQAHNAANEARLTDYSMRLQQEHMNILNDLKTKTNKDAIDARDGVVQSFDEAQKRLTDELKGQDPQVIDGFLQKAKQLSFTAQAEADAYIVEQSAKYRDTQRAAQVDNLYEQMALNFDNPVMFSKFKEEFEQARAMQDDELGIEPDSALSLAKTLKYTDDLYTNEATRLIGLKRFGDAKAILVNAAKGGLIRANNYNKQIASLVAQQESAARQAEADAQRRASFAMAQERHIAQLETEKLKQEKYQRDAYEQYLKDQYGEIPQYKRNAQIAMYVKGLKDNDAFKYSEQAIIDPDTGVQSIVTVENTAAQQNALINAEALKLQDNFELSRSIENQFDSIAYNVIGTAAQQGQGDTVLERAEYTYERMPQGADKEILGTHIQRLRSQDITEEEIETRVKTRFDFSKPTSTALAKEQIKNMAPQEVPVDANGNVDVLALKIKLNNKGIDNFDVLATNEEARKLVESQKNERAKLYESKGFKAARNSILDNVLYQLIDDDIISEDVFSIDLSDGSSSDPEDRNKYAAALALKQKVEQELEKKADAAGITDPNERQRYIISISNNASTKELFRQFSLDYQFDSDQMTNEEINAYNDERIKNWKGKQ